MATAKLLSELQADFGVEVIDAHCWPDDEDFYDGHHQNVRGASKFTTRFLSEVRTRLP